MTYLVGVTTTAVLNVGIISHGISPRQDTLTEWQTCRLEEESITLSPAAKTMAAESGQRLTNTMPDDLTFDKNNATN